MIIELHTPDGINKIDSDTVTDSQLAEQGLTREWLNLYLYTQDLHFEPPPSSPEHPGVPQRLEYIEAFLRRVYP